MTAGTFRIGTARPLGPRRHRCAGSQPDQQPGQSLAASEARGPRRALFIKDGGHSASPPCNHLPNMAGQRWVGDGRQPRTAARLARGQLGA